MMNPCTEFEYILIGQSQVIQLNVMAKLQKFHSLGVSDNTANTSNKISLTKRNFNKIKVFNKGIYKDLKGIIIWCVIAGLAKRNCMCFKC